MPENDKETTGVQTVAQKNRNYLCHINNYEAKPFSKASCTY